LSNVGTIITELEDALSGPHADRRLETLRRVTDLFVGAADGLRQEHVALFDDVMGRLSRGIETKARAELANRLAPIANAPQDMIRALSLDNDLEVAAPVLAQSARLGDEDLVEVIKTKSQGHLLAISTRDRLNDVVTDALVDRGDQQVMRTVAKNIGARFSDAGFKILVRRSQADDLLAELVGLRRDLPRHQFVQLFAMASDAVQRKLTGANPERVGDINRVLAGIAAEAIGVADEQARDYSAAKIVVDRLHASKNLDETQVYDFAQRGKFEETVASLAALCGFSTDMVENILFGENSELILILAKSLGFSWETTKHILRLCLDGKQVSGPHLDALQANFNKLQIVTAQRVVRFYKVRQTANEKALH
jgi:uncharacterized protein (DUF2336 family)